MKNNMSLFTRNLKLQAIGKWPEARKKLAKLKGKPKLIAQGTKKDC